MTWRDTSGHTLADYPRPAVAVDIALLTVTRDGLAVLLHERAEHYATGRWSLPGTFLHEDETLAQAAMRALRDKVGVTGENPRQLRVFDDPARDDRGRVLSVAHIDLVPARRLDGAALVPVAGDPPRARIAGGLAFDHDEIVTAAVAWARTTYRERPDPSGLIGEEFTLLELQRVHEAVLGEALQKDTFRRRMADLVEETGELSRGTVGKPARLFRRR